MTHGLVPTDRAGALKLAFRKFVDNNRYWMHGGTSVGRQVEFVIDRLGGFRSVHRLRIKRAWTQPISWLHDFSIGEVDISPAVQLTNGELGERLAFSMKSWDPHVSAHANLLRYIKAGSREAPFDAAEFREFWNRYCFPIADSKWTEQFP